MASEPYEKPKPQKKSAEVVDERQRVETAIATRRAGSKSRKAVVFELVADALHTFSLDLVKLICDFFPHFCLAGTALRPDPTHSFSFGSEGSGPGQFERNIEGIAVSPDGKLWVGSHGRVQVFSTEGKYLFEAKSDDGRGSWKEPRGIAFDTVSGEAFITDMHCVVVCRLDGKFVRAWGWYGNGQGQFSWPHGIAVDSKQGLVCVVDNSNARVQVFKRDGSFVRTIGSQGSGPGQIANPKSCCLTISGELAVANAANVRIEVCFLIPVSAAMLLRFSRFCAGVRRLWSVHTQLQT